MGSKWRGRRCWLRKPEREREREVKEREIEKDKERERERYQSILLRMVWMGSEEINQFSIHKGREVNQ